MAKSKRAASGAWQVINRVNSVIANTDTYTEAAKLLGISRRSLYNIRKVVGNVPAARGKKSSARTVMARRSTVSAWEDRLQISATKVITKQVQYTIEGQKPPRTTSQAARIISAGTGEKWTYQKLGGLLRRYKKHQVVPKEKPPGGIFIPPDDGITWVGTPGGLTLEDIESCTREDYDKGLTRHYTSDGTKDGVRFMRKGETWLNTDNSPRGLITKRDKVFQTEKEVTHWINDISNSKYVLVVVINIDDNGEEYFEVWLDSDSV